MDKIDKALDDHNTFARRAEPLRERIAELEVALRPFAVAANVSKRADAHHKISRADDESVGIVVNSRDLKAATAALAT